MVFIARIPLIEIHENMTITNNFEFMENFRNSEEMLTMLLVVEKMKM